MKRIQLFLAGACIAFSSVYAQDADWKADVAKVKELIATNPTQAAQDAEQLVKGKNKKNVDLLVALSQTYLQAGKISEAESYVNLAKKADSKSAAVSVAEGDIALARKEPGVACQLYEQAIYYNPNCEEAYIKFADVYKSSSASLAVEKLEQLKSLSPGSVAADKKLAEIHYLNNKFEKAVESYARIVDKPEATEDDLVKYAFALFLTHQFDKSLEVAQKGLQLNPRKAAFNRLVMYNNTDLKHYDEALKAADAFFNSSDKADYSYLDYKYYGHLLMGTSKYSEAVAAFKKAMELDPNQIDLWLMVSNAYEEGKEYKNAIDAFVKYMAVLPAEKQTADLQLQLGKMYYSEGTSADSLSVTPEDRKAALVSADSVFGVLVTLAPDSYLGNFWRARTNSALDPETTQGLAKPYYEQVAALLVSKNDPRYNSALIESYSYLGYYYLVANKLTESKEYWNKILAIDPANATAKKALDGIK